MSLSSGLASHPRIRRLFRRVYHRLPQALRRGVYDYRRLHAKPLHALLPLPMPEAMHVDPANVCNFHCPFCPTADKALLATVGRPHGLMPPALFEKILADMREMEARCGARLTTLHLYKDGEPLLNRDFAAMAAAAKKARVAAVVSTTTNASLLTPELACRLIDADLDQIRVSIVQIGERADGEAGACPVPYERIRQNVAFLFEEKRRRGSPLRVIVKTNDCGLSAADKERFERDFRAISDVPLIDALMGWSRSDAKDFTLGHAVATGMDGSSPLRERQVCPEPFSRLAVNFDGQVSVCCVDWSYGTIVGDLRRESLASVWEGERLREMRLAHLTGNRARIPACAHCQYSQGMPPARDLDGHVEALRRMYSGT